MRRIGTTMVMVAGLAAMLSACGGKKAGVMARGGPNELEVGRAAPLTVPPDYALQPPKPGAPRPVGIDTQGQALQALFGADIRAPARSPAENNLLNQAGAADQTSDARSTVGDPGATTVVDKGALTRTIQQVPEGDSQGAKSSVGG